MISRNIFQWERISPFSTLCCGNYRNLLSPKKIRQSKYLVIHLVKTLFSRNFCQKYVRLNHSNFHSVHTVLCKKHDHCYIHIFGKFNFFPSNQSYLLKSWFHGNFLSWSRFIVFFHTVSKHSKIGFTKYFYVMMRENCLFSAPCNAKITEICFVEIIMQTAEYELLLKKLITRNS